METDICLYCEKPIYWGPRDVPQGIRPDPDPSQSRHWRHEETQTSACNWIPPIQFAKPQSGQLSKDQLDFQNSQKKPSL